MIQSFHNGRVVLHPGDCMAVLKGMEDCSVDSVVCDPPYHLTATAIRELGHPSWNDKTKNYRDAKSRGFMGKQWDGGDIAFQPELWAEVLRVLKPGGHLVAFSGTRTYHNMAVAIEKAGFEIRDMLQWLYGSGFPKSHDVSKGIDRMLGAEREKVRVDASRLGNPPNLVGGAVKGDDRPWRQEAIERGYHERAGEVPATDAAREWQGWGTALKPACEPIAFARKPLGEKTVAANVLAHGTGALNIDGCRIATDEENRRPSRGGDNGLIGTSTFKIRERSVDDKPPGLGRWPANIIHDGSDEVVSGFPESKGQQGDVRGNEPSTPTDEIYGQFKGRMPAPARNDSGSAARFFYSAKADADDRIGSKHPTVKPVDLMRWLCRLVTPKGGTILDPFAGTGTTGAAAFLEGFNAILIEREPEYQADIARRMALLLAGPDEKAREIVKARKVAEPLARLPLFSKATEKP